MLLSASEFLQMDGNEPSVRVPLVISQWFHVPARPFPHDRQRFQPHLDKRPGDNGSETTSRPGSINTDKNLWHINLLQPTAAQRRQLAYTRRLSHGAH